MGSRAGEHDQEACEPRTEFEQQRNQLLGLINHQDVLPPVRQCPEGPKTLNPITTATPAMQSSTVTRMKGRHPLSDESYWVGAEPGF